MSASPRGWIAYVFPSTFPEGGAAARRVLGNAQSLLAAGWEVTVISAQLDTRLGVRQPLEPGLSLVSTGERDAENLPRALKRARYALMGRQTCQWIAAQACPPAAVVLYSGYSPYLMNLMPLCRRLKVPLVFDAVEWYAAPSRAGFLASPYLWNTEFALRVLIPRASGVIAISSWLANYYRGRGRPVVQIPPTLDTARVAPRLDDGQGIAGGPIRLSYCGSASNDLLDLVIAALKTLDPDGQQFVLDVAGPSRAEVLELPSLRGGSSLPPVVRLHGRLDHAESLALTRQADFSVFLRTVNRVSTAGFPTKFGESMAVGTPVITTLTSDLAAYLHDGENGLICPEASVPALITVLERIAQLSPAGRLALRQKARNTAEQCFDFRHYTARLGDFLGQLGLAKSGDKPCAY